MKTKNIEYKKVTKEQIKAWNKYIKKKKIRSLIEDNETLREALDYTKDKKYSIWNLDERKMKFYTVLGELFTEKIIRNEKEIEELIG